MRKEETVAVSAMRAGFTLIEILVAVAIIGILGTTAAIGIPRILENSKIKAAKVGVDNLKAADGQVFGIQDPDGPHGRVLSLDDRHRPVAIAADKDRSFFCPASGDLQWSHESPAPSQQ